MLAIVYEVVSESLAMNASEPALDMQEPCAVS